MSAGEQKSYRVAVFGVPDFEKAVINRIFALSSTRSNCFLLAEDTPAQSVDIMLVDKDNSGALSRWRDANAEYSQQPPPTIVVAAKQPPDCAFYVKRPFMATRLLGVLDRIVNERIRGLASSAEAGARPAAKAPGGADEDAGARYRALVVDDSLPVRQQIGKALTGAKVDAEFADSGEQALRLLEENAYDIVFLDVVMPGVDGYDVCKSIKRNKARKHIPVVMLTGKSSPFDKVKGRLSGCDSYLTKPVSRGDFVDTVKKYLKQPIVVE